MTGRRNDSPRVTHYLRLCLKSTSASLRVISVQYSNNSPGRLKAFARAALLYSSLEITSDISITIVSIRILFLKYVAVNAAKPRVVARFRRVSSRRKHLTGKEGREMNKRQPRIINRNKPPLEKGANYLRKKICEPVLNSAGIQVEWNAEKSLATPE
jgi:hypothetical protein